MIYILGDYIVDMYIFGDVERISPEGPIPIFKETGFKQRPGGAANVAANMRALRSDFQFFGTKNSTKIRYIADNRIVFRRDRDNPITNQDINYDWTDVTWCILSDYKKGYLDRVKDIIKSAKDSGVKIAVDPKRTIDEYTGADIVKFNLKELKDYADVEDLEECDSVRNKFNIGAVVVTLGSGGVYISSDEYTGTIPAEEHQVSDVTGAGDVFIAAMTHYLDRGCSLYDACSKANKLAGISVTKLGTYILQKEDLKQIKTVFTNGCFDIIHRGHVDYLKKSKDLGARLVIGLNSDESVKRLKGTGRPINNQEDRKSVLESLGCVDEVYIFDEDTPIELIKKIKPDIITKGGDYKTLEEVVGHDVVGEVQIIPFLDGYSTSEMLERMGTDSSG